MGVCLSLKFGVKVNRYQSEVFVYLSIIDGCMRKISYIGHSIGHSLSGVHSYVD